MPDGGRSNHHEPLVTATHALQLLTLFSDEHPELGVTEMSERLGLAKSIVSRIVSTYVAEGVLVQDDITRRYRLGPLLLELGLIAGELHPVRQAADALLKALRDETGQNTALWLRDGDEALCLASYRGPKAVDPPIPAGTRTKLADTVAGRALLGTAGSEGTGGRPGAEAASSLPARASAAQCHGRAGAGAWQGTGVERAGSRTSPKVGAGGVWISPEPANHSVYTAACCITDSLGEAVAVIAVSAPEAWFERQSPDHVEAAITRLAREVSARLS
ncbi:IclR family transcriptional regulator [Alicyclobacillus sp. ALC3]|uniref:IclR family transcriptional regulator n=1 Tax=Alicyclobacillus sp. ALC3 TaxID=2796143 RepID=UPI00237858B3|nr:helix-turn-helix domain-containing protein [Alicyclobacillus sp. ALC3]WDL95738.1 helix-turn-helix domain-containing protein [Alicyclobacillus sp. ALC3]